MAVQPFVTRDDLNVIGRFLVQELQKEIELQKHVATGKLLDSFEYRIKNTGNTVSLEIWSEDYGEYVDRGRKPGGKRVPIAALMEWIRNKAIASGDAEVKSIAFAIQEKIYREGIPTSGGRKIAQRRLNHIQFVIDKTQGEVDRLMNDRIQDSVRKQLDKAFEQAQRELKAAA